MIDVFGDLLAVAFVLQGLNARNLARHRPKPTFLVVEITIFKYLMGERPFYISMYISVVLAVCRLKVHSASRLVLMAKMVMGL